MKSEIFEGGITLCLGDCLEILPTLPQVDAVITDPVWPNCPPGLLTGSGDPDGLFANFIRHAPECRQMVICMRCDCDPRILRHIQMPFQQIVWMPYVIPGYAGRVLTNEVAYVFGQPIPSEKGRRVIPSQAPKSQPWDRPFQNGDNQHPCPRSTSHQIWLTDWFSLPAATILDPFMGSGTSAVAAVKTGRKYYGIEIEQKYFDVACRRVEDALRQSDMFIRRCKTVSNQDLLL